MISSRLAVLRKTLLLIFTILFLSFFVLPKPAISEARENRVLFMIAEKNIEDTHFFHWWSPSYWGASRVQTEHLAEVTSISTVEIALKEAFIRAGYKVVDPASIKDEVSIEDPYRLEDLNIKSTTYFGEVFGADVVVKGRAIARKGIKKSDATIGVYMADATAQAIRVSDGRVMASAMGHGVSRHISPTSGAIEALAKAADDLAGELIEQMSGQGE
ncbi:MAG: hypothetical protein V3V95_00435 [Thermodesulfobacteriota bacterium]